MASKGQKFNSYSKELKKEIMQKYLNNEESNLNFLFLCIIFCRKIIIIICNN